MKNQLIKTSVNELSRCLETEGLMKVDYKYDVTKATAALTYVGPKFDKDEWASLLAFFRWTYQEFKSESQCRIYYDPVDNKLRLVVLPQARRTGMTARELDTEDARAQRAALPNASDLVLFGSCHHHCSASAFMSSTDETNETSQTGIHITIGNVDQPVMSIHARFFNRSDLLEPDMSKFWDIGNELLSLPPEIVSMLPAEAEDKLARGQMTKAPPTDQSFPEQWRLNIIDPPKEHPHWFSERPLSHVWKDGEYRWAGADRYQRQGDDWVHTPTNETNVYVSKYTQSSLNGSGSTPPPQNQQGTRRRKQKGKDLEPVAERVDKAFKELIDAASVFQFESLDVEDAIDEACSNEIHKTIVQVCKDYDIVPDDLQQRFAEWKHDETQKALTDIQNGRGGDGPHNGWGFGFGG